MLFDVHAHYFPPKYLDLLEGFGKGDTMESRIQKDADLKDLEARIEMMDKAGMDVQVLSPAGQFPYFAGKEHSVRAARLANDMFAEFAARRPDRLACFVVTPLPHVDAALQELERGFDQLGAVGAAIASSVLGRSLADPEFDPFYEELNRRKATLYVHPAGLGAESPLISPHKMTWVIGAPIEDTLAAFHLIVAGIPSRYPDIKIIVSHHGGQMPTLLGRLDFLYASEVPETPELPSLAAKRMWYDTVAHDDPIALNAAWKAFGADKLVLGSDYPYQLGDDYTRCVSFLGDAGIPAQDVQIIRNTGDTLFPLFKRG